MTALAQDRNTQRKYVERVVSENPLIAATTTVWNGSLVANNAAGALIPASDTAGITVLGRASRRMVNPTGAAAAVVPAGKVEAGCYKFATTGGNALTIVDVGKNAYVLDDQTVVRAAGTTNSIIAGIVDSIDPDGGVWVKVNC
jgi:hypothetical protein